MLNLYPFRTTDLAEEEATRVFQPLVSAAVETSGLWGLMAEFCTIWPESAAETEMFTVDS